MSSPIRSLVNLLTFASLIGILLWRENVWQTRLQQASASPADPGIPKEIYTAGRDETMALRVETEVLQKKLAEAGARLSALMGEAETLKKAVQTAKPRPTQGRRTKPREIGPDHLFQWAFEPKEVLRSARLFALDGKNHETAGTILTWSPRKKS